MGTVSLLPSVVRLYLPPYGMNPLRLRGLHLLCTLLFSFLSFFLAPLELKSFFKRVKLSLNHSLRLALPTVFYEQTGVVLPQKHFSGEAQKFFFFILFFSPFFLEAEIMSVVVPDMRISVRTEKGDG